MLHRQATVPMITTKVTVMQESHTPPCLIMAELIQITGQPSVTEPGTRVTITLDCDIFFFICFCIYSSSLCVVYGCVHMWKRTNMHVRVEARGTMPDVFLGHSLPYEAGTPQVSQLVDQ